MKNICKTILTFAMAAMVFATASCSKEADYSEDYYLLLGLWYNTEGSCEITIAGQREVPEGCISLVFDGSMMEYYDMRTDDLIRRHKYTFRDFNGDLWIDAQESALGMAHIVELTDERLVLEDDGSIIDWGYHLVFLRGKKDTNQIQQ